MSTDLILAAIIQSEQDKSDLRCLVIPDGDWGPRCFQEAKVCARELPMSYPPDTHTQPRIGGGRMYCRHGFIISLEVTPTKEDSTTKAVTCFKVLDVFPSFK